MLPCAELREKFFLLLSLRPWVIREELFSFFYVSEQASDFLLRASADSLVGTNLPSTQRDAGIARLSEQQGKFCGLSRSEPFEFKKKGQGKFRQNPTPVSLFSCQANELHLGGQERASRCLQTKGRIRLGVMPGFL